MEVAEKQQLEHTIEIPVVPLLDPSLELRAVRHGAPLQGHEQRQGQLPAGQVRAE